MVDMAHKAGTAVRFVLGDCDSLWTSRGFVQFCDSMGTAREHSPPGAHQYNGVAESLSSRGSMLLMHEKPSGPKRR